MMQNFLSVGTGFMLIFFLQTKRTKQRIVGENF